VIVPISGKELVSYSKNRDMRKLREEEKAPI